MEDKGCCRWRELSVCTSFYNFVWKFKRNCCRKLTNKSIICYIIFHTHRFYLLLCRGQKYRFLCSHQYRRNEKKRHNEVISPVEMNIVICLKSKTKAFQNPSLRSVCSADIITPNLEKLSWNFLHISYYSFLHAVCKYLPVQLILWSYFHHNWEHRHVSFQTDVSKRLHPSQEILNSKMNHNCLL